ncbi:surface antigen BspA-like [Trichomonas vaginalis G3]|uniref:Surface antigen BspA-like n=1 Tax=Trichomonas vaginalis (strain ATCC PRA-98 / G3) TaxID=412133 RepID=A2E8P3_TRIV3|nr:regulation of response to stimulus [Trichomonas vaginalis G3]EAY10982.1 surface antigen BspA-like [Trichomonas vaginalis G3]KAI5530817.1 regulation of response to stimulus [Trichomonas vaginalis G3]|eukprot:XP_001323205.1 surface antigen BspA-like [Trichomonas vaginalis G3]
MSSIPETCFKNCYLLTSIELPNNIYSIGTEAFTNTSITSITIPDTVTRLSRQCFRLCTKLTDVTLTSNSNLVNFDYGVFDGCNSLSRFTDFQSINFCTDNGALYNSERTQLYVYPPASPNRFFTFTDRIRIIENGAFIGCHLLESILIPDRSVETIGENAFYGCKSLQTINLPYSIKSIGSGAFVGCDKLVCGVICQNKSREFVDMLFESSLNMMSLRVCNAQSCKMIMNSCISLSYLIPFVTILL